MEIVTYFDSKYSDRGISMIESIKKHEPGSKFHILCLDKEVEKILDFFYSDDTSIKKYSLESIEKKYPEILDVKKNLESGFFVPKRYFNFTPYQNYLWILTPFFCNIILKECDSGEILYCDADLYFYDNFKELKRELQVYSVGIVTHITPYHVMNDTPSGKYNVGIVYFKRSEMGVSCSDFWKWLLLNEPNHNFYEKYGSCGDQKYLELFPNNPFFGNSVKIIGDSLTYGAVWSWEEFKFTDKLSVILDGSTKKILFSHFSSLVINDEGYDSYRDGPNKPININNYIKELYDEYFLDVIEVRKKIKDIK